MYEPILANDCIPLTEIPFTQQETFARDYLLRDCYVDIDLISLPTAVSSSGFLSHSNHQRFARWLVQLATAQQTIKVEEKPLTKRRDQTAVL